MPRHKTKKCKIYVKLQFYLLFFALRIVLLERTSNNLTCFLKFFLCVFCASFALLEAGLADRNLTLKGIKIELLLQKTQYFFAFCFQRPLSGVSNFNTSPVPPLPPLSQNFLLDALNSEQNLLEKKRSTGPVRKRSTGRLTGVVFEIYRSGRENPDLFHLCIGSPSILQFVFCTP